MSKVEIKLAIGLACGGCGGADNSLPRPTKKSAAHLGSIISVVLTPALSRLDVLLVRETSLAKSRGYKHSWRRGGRVWRVCLALF